MNKEEEAIKKANDLSNQAIEYLKEKYGVHAWQRYAEVHAALIHAYVTFSKKDKI